MSQPVVLCKDKMPNPGVLKKLDQGTFYESIKSERLKNKSLPYQEANISLTKVQEEKAFQIPFKRSMALAR